jgi:hypothetical protein
MLILCNRRKTAWEEDLAMRKEEVALEILLGMIGHEKSLPYALGRARDVAEAYNQIYEALRLPEEDKEKKDKKDKKDKEGKDYKKEKDKDKEHDD